MVHRSLTFNTHSKYIKNPSTALMYFYSRSAISFLFYPAISDLCTSSTTGHYKLYIYLDFLKHNSPISDTILTNGHFSGSALLVCPVTDPGVTEVRVLLPGSDEVSLIHK